MKICYITFHSVSDSLAFEKAIEKEELDVRLVPVPREISSSCGVAAMFPPEIRSEVESFLEKVSFEIEGIHELEKEPGKKNLLERFRSGSL